MRQRCTQAQVANKQQHAARAPSKHCKSLQQAPSYISPAGSEPAALDPQHTGGQASCTYQNLGIQVLTSALVGVGLVIMDSSMLVATMTGLPRLRHPCTMRLCQ